MTGAILKLLPSICTGKLTYFNASYWHELAYTFEKEMATYFHRGAAFRKLSPLAKTIPIAKSTAARRFKNTKKTESWNRNGGVPYGIDMIRS
jgi:hypothetical protein